MNSFGSSNKFFLPLLRVAIIILHQNCVSLPPVAEALRGVIWNKNSGDFVKIFSIESYVKIKEEYSMIGRKEETHDFQGKQLRFTSFAIKDLINFETNEFNETVLTGVHGEMWQALSQMLNFRLLIVEVKEAEFGIRDEKTGHWDGLMDYIYRNETDIIPRTLAFPSRLTALELTLATWTTGYRFYMKKQAGYHRTWMIELFGPRLWLSIVVSFFALVFTNYTIHVCDFKYNKKARYAVTHLRDHIFYIYSIFCIQGWLPSFMDKHSRIVLLSSRLLAWLLFIAFGTKLISHIAHRTLPHPFEDLEGFYGQTDYKLVVKRNSFVYSIFKRAPRPIYRTIFTSGRLIQSDMALKAYDKMCTGKYVYFDAEDTVEATKFDKCKHNVVGKSYYDTWIASGLVRGFEYKKSIDLGILKLRQFGIVNRLKLKWMKKSKGITTSETTEAIRMAHVSLIFAMLLGAMVLSFVILVIENVVYLGVRKNRRKRFFK